MMCPDKSDTNERTIIKPKNRCQEIFFVLVIRIVVDPLEVVLVSAKSDDTIFSG